MSDHRPSFPFGPFGEAEPVYQTYRAHQNFTGRYVVRGIRFPTLWPSNNKTVALDLGTHVESAVVDKLLRAVVQVVEGEDLRAKITEAGWQHWQYYSDIAEWDGFRAPSGPDDVWNHLDFGPECVEVVAASGKAYVLIESSPTWEVEHGLVFVFESGVDFVGVNFLGDGIHVHDHLGF